MGCRRIALSRLLADNEIQDTSLQRYISHMCPSGTLKTRMNKTMKLAVLNRA